MSVASAEQLGLLIVGCGYVGNAVAQLAKQTGATVYALTRNEARVEEFRRAGVHPVVGHWLDPSSLAELPSVDRVLICVPHRADETGFEPEWQQQSHAIGINHLLTSLPPSWNKLVYLSTTGVYGQDSDAPINEDTPVSPSRLGPQIAVAAEEWLGKHLQASRFTVLRLAGIYGPGRIPLADRLRRGESLAVPRSGYLNLVHLADIARVVMAVFERPMRRSTYVLSDGRPVQREIFYRTLADLCGVQQPHFCDPDPADPRVRRATDKRIDPARIVDELAFEFRFPDFRAGLAQALQLP